MTRGDSNVEGGEARPFRAESITPQVAQRVPRHAWKHIASWDGQQIRVLQCRT